MPALLSALLVQGIAWVGKVLGVKLGLLAIAIATVAGVLLATKVAFAALLALVPYVPIPGPFLQVAQGLAPTNIDDALRAIVDAWVLRLVFMSQWV